MTTTRRPPAKRKFDKDQFWKDFQDWYSKWSDEPTCSKCGHGEFDEPSWVEQEEWITAQIERLFPTRTAKRKKGKK
jgi:hypothetical protein